MKRLDGGAGARADDPVRLADIVAALDEPLLDFAPFGEQIIPKNSDFAVPQVPGLGQDPDLELVERMRVA